LTELSDSQAFTPGLEAHFAIADGIATLFAPYVEVVIHDLATEEVAYISNDLSRRVAGDPSQLDEIGFDPDLRVIGPYQKTNWDGRRMKCISIVLREKDAPIGLMCLNVDVTQFDLVRRALDGFLGAEPRNEGVQALFVHDWHEKINQFVADWCATRDIRIEQIDKASRRELISALRDSGALEQRRAPAYIARILGVSRATVYNELAALKQGSSST
jgi:predicted transcriptional regulator YheO